MSVASTTTATSSDARRHPERDAFGVAVIGAEIIALRRRHRPRAPVRQHVLELFCSASVAR
jgi:hypothetical protein